MGTDTLRQLWPLHCTCKSRTQNLHSQHTTVRASRCHPCSRQEPPPRLHQTPGEGQRGPGESSGSSERQLMSIFPTILGGLIKDLPPKTLCMRICDTLVSSTKCKSLWKPEGRYQAQQDFRKGVCYLYGATVTLRTARGKSNKGTTA